MSTSAIISIVGCVIAGAATAIFMIVQKLNENKSLKEANIRMEERCHAQNAIADEYDDPEDDWYAELAERKRRKRALRQQQQAQQAQRVQQQQYTQQAPPPPVQQPQPQPTYQAPPPPPQPVQQTYDPALHDSRRNNYTVDHSVNDGINVTLIRMVGQLAEQLGQGMNAIHTEFRSMCGGVNNMPTYMSPYGYNPYGQNFYACGGGWSSPHDDHDLDRFFSKNRWNLARQQQQQQQPPYGYGPYGASYSPFKRPTFMYDPQFNHGSYPPPPPSQYQPTYPQMNYPYGGMSGTDRMFAEKTYRIDPNTGDRYDINGCKLYVDRYGNVLAEPSGGFRYDINGNQYDGFGNLVRRAEDVLPCHREEQARNVQMMRNANQPPPSPYNSPQQGNPYNSPQQGNPYNSPQQTPFGSSASGRRLPTPEEADRLVKGNLMNYYNSSDYNFIRPITDNGSRRNDVGSSGGGLAANRFIQELIRKGEI